MQCLTKLNTFLIKENLCTLLKEPLFLVAVQRRNTTIFLHVIRNFIYVNPKISVGMVGWKSEGKRLPERPRYRWEYNMNGS
jgi:hypothetical protein